MKLNASQVAMVSIPR